MRIVAGKYAGVGLISPGPRIRPTKEEVRDAWLTTLGEDIPRAKVLDLFAGTGALGLEALSRGATSVDFVENGSAALHAVKANLAKLRVKDWTRLFKKDAFLFLEGIRWEEPNIPPYDIALADPPYTSRAAEQLVKLWLQRKFSRILSVEHDAGLTLPKGGIRRRFGDTAVTTYRIRKKKARSQRRKPSQGQKRT